MLIEITYPCFIAGVSRAAGEVLDVKEADGYSAIGTGRAKIAAAGAILPSPESVPPILTETKESALPARKRR